ncbi:hypothetical protein LTS18_007791, partial [Coniosporium uncinatum]
AGWKSVFWGPNYASLLRIKQKYDPQGVFWVTPGVGADLFEVKEGRVCKAAGTASAANALPPLNDNSNYAMMNDYDADGSAFPIIMGPNGPMKNPASNPNAPVTPATDQPGNEGTTVSGEGGMEPGMPMGSDGSPAAPAPAPAAAPAAMPPMDGHSHGGMERRVAQPFAA